MSLQANVELEPHIVQNLVETHYGYHVKQLKKVRAVYRLETDQGIVAFKNARKMRDIHFIDAVIQHLHANGFKKIPTLRRMSSGKLMLGYRGDAYMLEEWLPEQVREVPPKQDDWLYPAGKALATFHEAISSFPASQIPQGRIRTAWRDWLFYHYQKTNRTCSYEQAEARDWLVGQMQLAYQLSEQRRETADYHLCHGSLHQENIMIDTSGEVWLIDYERFTYDETAKDLAQLLDYHFHYHQWNRTAIEQLFGGYESVRSLQDSDIISFCSRIMVPEKIIRAYQSGKSLRKIREQAVEKEQVLRALFPSLWN